MREMVGESLASRIERVRDQVQTATVRSGRNADAVTIVAVSKTVGRPDVDAAYELGLRHFGENRVLDARDKFVDALPSDARLHMIGQLQTNKAAIASRVFHVFESVDRVSLVEELNRQGTKLGLVLPVLVEVNVGGEDQKAGCPIASVRDLVSAIEASPGLQIQGLMTMAPLVDDVESVRPVFRGLRELRDEIRAELPDLRLPVLSMGMSNDFLVAIEEGATQVRIGRAIFGG